VAPVSLTRRLRFEKGRNSAKIDEAKRPPTIVRSPRTVYLDVIASRDWPILERQLQSNSAAARITACERLGKLVMEADGNLNAVELLTNALQNVPSLLVCVAVSRHFLR